MTAPSRQHPATIRVRRVYDAPDGGYRVLVDRLWPRGIAKADLDVDEWCQAVAPSAEARTWFNHDLERFEGFRKRYLAELEDAGNPEAPDDGGAPAVQALLERWKDSRKNGPHDLVLLYAAKDTENNHAVVLREVLGQASGTRTEAADS